MQSVLDNLCRCFGTSPLSPGEMDEIMASSQDSPHRTATGSTPATPDMKRRTRSLALKDDQWDDLFKPECIHPTGVRTTTSDNARQKESAESGHQNVSMEQAQAVAKAKLAASATNPKHRLHKRKRSTSASKDDIFRSKKVDPQSKPGNGPNVHPNPFSRFLSNHPVIASSLCFATPVRGSTDEPHEVPLNNSMVSDTNTLNTAEDTITSTVYYEKTKLAGLQQTSPPMPLFNTFAVEEKDEIRKIVASDSHSSLRMIDMFRQQNQQQVVTVQMDEDEEETDQSENEMKDKVHPKHHQQQSTPQRRHSRRRSDDAPPPMTDSSSDSTRS